MPRQAAIASLLASLGNKSSHPSDTDLSSFEFLPVPSRQTQHLPQRVAAAALILSFAGSHLERPVADQLLTVHGCVTRHVSAARFTNRVSISATVHAALQLGLLGWTYPPSLLTLPVYPGWGCRTSCFTAMPCFPTTASGVTVT